jgi:hypothetical protein
MGNPIVKLKKRLNSVEKNLFNITLELNETKQTKNSYFARKKKQINKQYEKARIIFKEWSLLNIPKSFDEEMRQQIKRIKSLKFNPEKSVDYMDYKDNAKNSNTKERLTKETINDYTLGLDKGNKKYTKLIRTTQQVNVTEKEVDKAVAEGLKGPRSVFKAKKKLQNVLMRDALDKEYITVIDKNGNLRNYKIKSYAELVARTKMTDASTEAVLSTADGFGSDLVQVSSHNTNTKFDAQFEGKIYSLSGKDKEFPKATFLPPFHPRCIHTISVWFRDAHTPGQVEKASDFSKGKTEVHPTRKSHVPVSKRK